VIGAAGARLTIVALAGGLLASCSATTSGIQTREHFAAKKYAPASPRVVASTKVPKGGGHYMIGNPYRVAGKTYIPADNPSYVEVGMASWYGDAFHGRLTANGEVYDVNALTAAHPTLPLPSYARVTNLDNGSSIVVRVNDRGPFAHNRIIDVSERAADLLGFRTVGTARVKVAYLGPARMDGRDGKMLAATYHGPRYGSPVKSAPVAPPTSRFMVASAPTPHLVPRRLPDEAFAPTPATSDPLTLIPTGATTGVDLLAPLIMRAELTSSYAETARLSAAQAAVDDFARPRLVPASQTAASGGASALPPHSVIVQVGSFSDPTNAERVAAQFDSMGSSVITVHEAGGRMVNVVHVAAGEGTTAEAIIAAAAAMGLPGAFVVNH